MKKILNNIRKELQEIIKSSDLENYPKNDIFINRRPVIDKFIKLKFQSTILKHITKSRNFKLKVIEELKNKNIKTSDIFGVSFDMGKHKDMEDKGVYYVCISLTRKKEKQSLFYINNNFYKDIDFGDVVIFNQLLNHGVKPFSSLTKYNIIENSFFYIVIDLPRSNEFFKQNFLDSIKKDGMFIIKKCF